jgi:TolB-like protein/class 3 adenylate cyclase/Tfp pilus assembly protein PilF
MRETRSVTTVLFTDLVGSTARAAELGDRDWRKLQAEHHARVRREIRRFGGREANTAGDAFLASFDRPASALRCAHAIRETLHEVGLEIRAGVHAGEVDGVGRDLGGLGVHVGSRVESAAAPGEILVSGTVRELVLGAGFKFEDRGEHELKGVPGTWRLYALTELPAGPAFRTGRWVPDVSRRAVALGAVILVLVLAAVAALRLGGSGEPRDSGPGVPVAASIAVLPFENMSGDEAAQPFTDGLHDDLLTQLVKIGGLKVISRTSVMAYRDSPLKIGEIAEELGVATVLEGGVQRTEDRVRVNVQLIDAASDAHLWAETFDRTLTAEDLFEIQREIATEIATTLQARLTAEERERLAEVPTEDLEAYEHYLRGRDFFRRNLVLGDVRAAVEEFQAAVDSDPSFAEAWAMLSIGRATLSWEFGLNSERPAAEQAARTALELAPRSPLSLAAMGYERYYGHRQYEAALEFLHEAEAIAPNDPDVLAAIGFVLRRQGKFREALSYFERAFDRDPRSLDLTLSLGDTYRLVRDYDSARRFIERAIAIDPNYWWSYTILAEVALESGGDIEEATRIVEEAATRMDPALVVLPSMVLSRALASTWGERLRGAAASAPQGGRPLYAYKELNPFNVHIGKGFMLLALGETEPARAQFDSTLAIARTIEPETFDVLHSAQGYLYGALGIAQAGAGDPEAGVQTAQKGLAALEPQGDVYTEANRRLELADVYMLAGRHAEALDELEWLLSHPSEYSTALAGVDPIWNPLRQDPRFRRLVEGDG